MKSNQLLLIVSYFKWGIGRIIKLCATLTKKTQRRIGFLNWILGVILLDFYAVNDIWYRIGVLDTCNNFIELKKCILHYFAILYYSTPHSKIMRWDRNIY